MITVKCKATWLHGTLEWLGDLWAGHTVEGSDDGARYMKSVNMLGDSTSYNRTTADAANFLAKETP